jgi:hypothetical protein
MTSKTDEIEYAEKFDAQIEKQFSSMITNRKKRLLKQPILKSPQIKPAKSESIETAKHSSSISNLVTVES